MVSFQLIMVALHEISYFLFPKLSYSTITPGISMFAVYFNNL